MMKIHSIRKTEIIEVIRTEIVAGTGKDNDPLRPAFQYWSKDGELLAEADIHAPQTQG